MDRSAALRHPGSLFQTLRAADAVTSIRMFLVCIGLVTISWERLGNFPLGPYNVKVSSLAFSLAALLALPLIGHLWRVRTRPLVRASVVTLVLVLWLGICALLAEDRGAALGQLVAIATGAVAPAVALLCTTTSVERLVLYCRALVTGGYVACVFGLYQLAAFYLHIPQFIAYTGRGIDGGSGRIAAFNYEPAYFAYFLILVIGARLTLAKLRDQPVPWIEIAFFALVLELANVRALLIAVPVLILALLRWREQWRTVVRIALVGVVVVSCFAVGPTIASRIHETAGEGNAPQSSSSTGSPASTATASAPATRTESASPAPVGPPPESVFSPSEPSSNAPRLARYLQVADLVKDHLVVGVGPGNLGRGLATTSGGDEQGVVANDIWLQALSDGGIPALLLELALVLMLAAAVVSTRFRAVQPLAVATFTIVIVGGLLTSYFFDAKVWVGAALLLAAGTTASPAPRRAS